MKQKILNQFGTLANACKELGLAYRTLRKYYEDDYKEDHCDRKKSTIDRIKGRGYNPKTFKPL
jgi:hypothetical protein